MRVHFVCAGNICRSVLAARLFDETMRGGGRGYVATSAGLVADPDDAVPNELTIRAGRAVGVDVADHRARRFDPCDVAADDLVLVMELEQAAEVMAKTGLDPSSVRLLGSYCSHRDAEIADPGGRVFAEYERTVKHIQAAVAGLCECLRSTGYDSRPIR